MRVSMRVRALIATVWVAASLFGKSSHSFAQVEKAPAILGAVADYTSSMDGTRVDRVLRDASFDAQYTQQIAAWPSFSPLRKLDVAYKAAADVSPESGERFLALLARATAQQYGSDPDLAALAAKASDSAPPSFKLSRLDQAKLDALPPPHVRKVLSAVAEYVSERGPVTTRTLGRLGGFADDELYDILRRSPTHEAAIAEMHRRRPGALQVWMDHLGSHYSTFASDERVRRYGWDPDGHGPSAPDSSPPRGDGSGGRTHGPGDPGDGHGTWDIRPPPRPSGGGSGGRGGGGAAAARFNQIMNTRMQSAPGGRLTFKAMTSGRLGGRLGGVVFGNDTRSRGPIGPASVSLTSGVDIKGTDGRNYRLDGADVQEACLAIRVIESKVYGMAGLTDRMSRPGGASFNVALHPQLVNTTVGKDMVLIDALPINLATSVSQIAGDSPAARRVRDLFGNMTGIGTWQIVDVETDVELRDGRVLVQPRLRDKRSPVHARDAFIELRPITEGKVGEMGFDLTWANRFREELPVLRQVVPPFDRANRFARTLAALRWAASKGAKLPQGATCAAPKADPTPDAVAVTRTAIEWVPSYDLATEICRRSGATDPALPVCGLMLECMGLSAGTAVTDLRRVARCVTEGIVERCEAELGADLTEASMGECATEALHDIEAMMNTAAPMVRDAEAGARRPE